jgi:hypothetical protein
MKRLIQDNETPPLSALKVVVKSATTSVREFKSGCKVCDNLCYNLWLYPLDLHILQSRASFWHRSTLQ